jgi:hypothetical protein
VLWKSDTPGAPIVGQKYPSETIGFFESGMMALGLQYSLSSKRGGPGGNAKGPAVDSGRVISPESLARHTARTVARLNAARHEGPAKSEDRAEREVKPSRPVCLEPDARTRSAIVHVAGALGQRGESPSTAQADPSFLFLETLPSVNMRPVA